MQNSKTRTASGTYNKRFRNNSVVNWCEDTAVSHSSRPLAPSGGWRLNTEYWGYSGEQANPRGIFKQFVRAMLTHERHFLTIISIFKQLSLRQHSWLPYPIWTSLPTCSVMAHYNAIGGIAIFDIIIDIAIGTDNSFAT
eukprot:6208830-Pleurochrysis_carterae.AAC.2